MNFEPKARTILLVVAGSRAYGINTPESDIDVKGVLIPPLEYYIGLPSLYTFEQTDSPSNIGEFYNCFTAQEKTIIDKTKLEGTIYELRKFFSLAKDCNPNILDVLFCKDEDVRHLTHAGKILRENREMFISSKARWTFSGYAISQLKRIKTHKKWLLSPILSAPSRSAFGLPETPQINKETRQVAEAAIRKRIDDWEVDYLHLDESQKIYIKSQIEKYMYEISFEPDDSFRRAGMLLGFDDNFMEVLEKERLYKNAQTEWTQYNSWLKNRNPARAALEEKHGYDTKHAAHLFRLLTMCEEILLTGKVNVCRKGIDAELIKSIRNGSWSYEELIKWAEEKDNDIAKIYNSDSCVTPRSPDVEKINALSVELISMVMQNPDLAFKKIL